MSPTVEFIWNFWPFTMLPIFWMPFRFLWNFAFFFFIPYLIMSPVMFLWNLIPMQVSIHMTWLVTFIMWLVGSVLLLVGSVFIVTIPFTSIGWVALTLFTMFLWVL